MTIEFIAAIALAQQDWPKVAELQSGELVRLYERTMSRRGQFDKVMVLTPNKVFVRDGDMRNWAMLTDAQQAELKTIMATEPVGLRNKKRQNPMWPSAYDGSDQWMNYKTGRGRVRQWTNKEFEYPHGDCPLTAFLESLRTQLASG